MGKSYMKVTSTYSNLQQQRIYRQLPTQSTASIAHDVDVFINRVERNGISMFIYKKTMHHSQQDVDHGFKKQNVSVRISVEKVKSHPTPDNANGMSRP